MRALAFIKERNNSLYALLRSTTVRLSDSRLTIHSRFNFHRDRIMETKNRGLIEQSLLKVYGKKLAVIGVVDQKAAPEPVDQASELVSSALEILGGEVIDG
jgi:hypothetical protein